MSSLSKHGDGYRAQIYVKGVRKSKTFRTKREAVAWGFAEEIKIQEDHKRRSVLLKRIGGSQTDPTLQNIMERQSAIPNVSGIYILLADGVVSYVGKSNNMLSRIASHSTKGRKFTHYFAMPYCPEDLDAKEAHYIKLLEPTENRCIDARFSPVECSA